MPPDDRGYLLSATAASLLGMDNRAEAVALIHRFGESSVQIGTYAVALRVLFASSAHPAR
jgi:hypothetical protein